ncbi:MAG: methyltransferase domain-containing protein [Hydrogenothermaceae bacterium]|nr:methyltransferase domain-containing protein [Hydrogenothermaceae bacterium]
MIDIKKIYRLSFSKAAKTYEEEACIQRETAKIIASKLELYSGLGLDCGSGTCFVSELLPGKRLVNLDISKSMTKVCKSKGYKVVVGDVECLPFKEEVFDYVASNFTLHWTDLEVSLWEIKRVMKRGSTFIFSIPVEGSLKAIHTILGNSFFQFYPESVVESIVSRHFKLSNSYNKDFEMIMDDGLLFLRHLHLTGSMVNPRELSMKEKLSIVKKFATHTDKTLLNFNVAFFECVKV